MLLKLRGETALWCLFGQAPGALKAEVLPGTEIPGSHPWASLPFTSFLPAPGLRKRLRQGQREERSSTGNPQCLGALSSAWKGRGEDKS